MHKKKYCGLQPAILALFVLLQVIYGDSIRQRIADVDFETMGRIAELYRIINSNINQAIG